MNLALIIVAFGAPACWETADTVVGFEDVSTELSAYMVRYGTARRDGRPDGYTVVYGGHDILRAEDRDNDGYFDLLRFMAQDGELLAELIDRNEDGKVDEWLVRMSDGTYSRFMDRNFDGRVEQKKTNLRITEVR